MNAKHRFSVLCTVTAISLAAHCAAQTPAAATAQPSAQTPAQAASAPREYKPTGNPMFSHKFTADPAPVVIGDTLWMITSHDETAPNGRMNRNFRMRDWCLFSTKDMKTWTEYPTPLSVDEFKWDGTHTAYAAQMIPRDGKYYLYISTNGNGIGVTSCLPMGSLYGPSGLSATATPIPLPFVLMYR